MSQRNLMRGFIGGILLYGLVQLAFVWWWPGVDRLAAVLGGAAVAVVVSLLVVAFVPKTSG